MSLGQPIPILLAADLVKRIDAIEPDRRRFVVQAIERELGRRRREALLLSLATPHPETAASARPPLADWDLPTEGDLVDSSAGIAVRWAEEQGWVADAI